MLPTPPSKVECPARPPIPVHHPLCRPPCLDGSTLYKVEISTPESPPYRKETGFICRLYLFGVAIPGNPKDFIQIQHFHQKVQKRTRSSFFLLAIARLWAPSNNSSRRHPCCCSALFFVMLGSEVSLAALVDAVEKLLEQHGVDDAGINSSDEALQLGTANLL